MLGITKLGGMDKGIFKIGSDKPAVYVGVTDAGLHKFVIFKSQPYFNMYFKILPPLRNCEAHRVYATQIYLEPGNSVLFETNKGLAMDRIDQIFADSLLLDSGFRIEKKYAFIYEEFEECLQAKTTIQPALQSKGGQADQCNKNVATLPDVVL